MGTVELKLLSGKTAFLLAAVNITLKSVYMKLHDTFSKVKLKI
jgi:hypothetical protein